MNYKNGVKKSQLLRADISLEEKQFAKKLAKSKGMTFQGWLGFVIREEIRKDNTF